MERILAMIVLLSSVCSEEVCFPPCGCFDDRGPFEKRPLPLGPGNGSDIIWTLFTQLSQNEELLITFKDDTWDVPTAFDPSKPSHYLVHGWMSSPGVEWEPSLEIDLKLKIEDTIDDSFLSKLEIEIEKENELEKERKIQFDKNKNEQEDKIIQEEDEKLNVPSLRDIKDTILELYDHNVILVDWSEGAANLNYFQSAANTRVVGACTGLLATHLQSASMVHCVGHSLGGHACGYVGNHMEGQLSWISGLDPAGPYFDVESEDVRLDSTDAQFVDVIHTSSSNKLALGLDKPMGHADFYPNMGHDQPPCEGRGGGCDHTVCKAYYQASIEHTSEECAFLGFPCYSIDDVVSDLCNTCQGESCQTMGWWSVANKDVQGTFYLEVDRRYPFCQYCIDKDDYETDTFHHRNMSK